MRNGREGAFTEVFGTILLIGITVAMAAGLAIIISSQLKPTENYHTDLSLTATPGPDGRWGSGDELLVLTHGGGEALSSASTSVFFRTNETITRYTGGSLAGDAENVFADGMLTIGETWRRTVTIPVGAEIELDVVSIAQSGDANVVGAFSHRADCTGELDPPFASAWSRAPSTLTMASSGPLTVTVSITDACAGVNGAVVPHLYYRLAPSGPFTDAGTMTAIATNTWRGDVPDLVWRDHGGETLYYYVSPLTDRFANTAQSTTQTLVIGRAPVYTYAAAYSATMGTVSAFPNLQSAADAGAFATLADANGLGAPNAPAWRYGASAVGTGGATTPANAAGAPDATYATLPANADAVTVSGFTVTGAISKVEIAADLKYAFEAGSVPVDDRATLSYSIPGCTTCTRTAAIAPTAANATTFLDVTADKAAWTPADIALLAAKVTYAKTSAEDRIDLKVNAVWLRITTLSTVYAMDIRVNATSLPPGASTLELNARATSDTYRVSLWNATSSAWNLDPVSIAPSGSFAAWTHALTAAERASGTVLVRFTDVSPIAQGSLDLDHMRVKTE